ncbi:MAG: hypothetical protein ACI9K5_003377, partial [Gammaproteobacteria bacterium]
MATPRPARLRAPLWLSIVLLLPFAAILWLQLTDGTGDVGMNNVFTYMAVMLIASIYGVWFLVASGQTLRCKLTTFGVLGVAVGAVV